MSLKRMLSLAALAAILIPAAFAQTATTTTTTTATPHPPTGKTIHQRKVNQQRRIGNGVQSGQLTAGETARLENKERKLNREEHRMKSDGNLSAKERAKLTHQQNRLSKDIYKQKHDAQTRK